MSDDELSISEVAERYLAAVQKEAAVDAEQKESLADEIETSEKRLAELETEFGEEDDLVVQAAQDLAVKRNKYRDITGPVSEKKCLQNRLLERIHSTFILSNDKWLQPTVIRAVTHVLTEREAEVLLLGDTAVEDPDDVDGVDDPIEMSYLVRKIAAERLGERTSIRRLWESIEASSKHEPFLIVARDSGISPAEVEENLGADADYNVGQMLIDTVKLEYSPYHRNNHTYSLSLVGQYFYQTYVPDGERKTDKSSQADGEDVVHHKQSTFDD